MASRLIPVIERVDYSIGLAANGTQEIQFGNSYNPYSTPDWVSAQLIVIVQAKNFSASASASVDVRAHNTFVDPKSPPGTIFAASANPATITIANGDPAGRQYIGILSPVGPYLAASLLYSQGANTGTCTWTMSVYLLGRDA